MYQNHNMEEYVKNLSAKELANYIGRLGEKSKTQINLTLQKYLLKVFGFIFMIIFWIIVVYFSWLPAAKVLSYDWVELFPRIGILVGGLVWFGTFMFIIWGLFAEDSKLIKKLFMPIEKWEAHIEEVGNAQKEQQELERFAEENEEFMKKKLEEYERYLF